MANLKKLNTKDSANRGTTIEVPDPTDGTPSGFKITILGKDSDAYRRVEASQRERAIRMANTTGTFRVSPEQIEHNTLELISCCVVGWEGLEDENGQSIPFNQENLKSLLNESPYVKEILDRNIGDRSIFSGR